MKMDLQTLLVTHNSIEVVSCLSCSTSNSLSTYRRYRTCFPIGQCDKYNRLMNDRLISMNGEMIVEDNPSGVLSTYLCSVPNFF